MQIKKRKSGPSLGKIIVLLLAACGMAYGVYRGVNWYQEDSASAALAEDAEVLLAKAETALANGRPSEAETTAAPLVEHMEGHDWGPRAAAALASALRQQQRLKEAEAILAKAAQQFPAHPLRAELLMQYGSVLDAQQKTAGAQRIYKQISETAAPPIRGAALAALGKQAMRRDERLEARRLFHEAMQGAAPDTAAFDEALERLGDVNAALAFGPEATPESRVYIVEPGDNLISIGIKLNTTQGLLMRANNISDPASLRVGQRLKYTPKDFHILIERATCRLYLVDSHGIFKRYDTGLGKPGHETTLGAYKIGNKQKDPAWFKPGEGEIPPGDPRNELGTRWMPLVPLDPSLPTDLGIHGTIDPASIGKHSSHGCARMHNTDAEELYDLVVRSTPVEIVEHIDLDGLLHHSPSPPSTPEKGAA